RRPVVPSLRKSCRWNPRLVGGPRRALPTRTRPSTNRKTVARASGATNPQRGRVCIQCQLRMAPAPAKPTPLSTRGQAGIFPSPGRVSSTGRVDRAGAGPPVVGGSVPATVVGTAVVGVVLGPLLDDRRGVVRATVGR